MWGEKGTSDSAAASPWRSGSESESASDSDSSEEDDDSSESVMPVDLGDVSVLLLGCSMGVSADI